MKNNIIKQDLYNNFILNTQPKVDNLFYNNFKIFKKLEENEND
jgi:hypothetical protein